MYKYMMGIKTVMQKFLTAVVHEFGYILPRQAAILGPKEGTKVMAFYQLHSD